MNLKSTASGLLGIAEIEIERRRRARERGVSQRPGFDNWLRDVTPNWNWDWKHLVHVRSYLERLTRGEVRKLLVLTPPRHGKTEHGTVRYPVWRLERDPDLRVIIGAYNQTLANKFSRKCRRIAQERFPLSDDRKAVEDWETRSGGGVRAVGVGSGITGQGGDLIIIDDPIKSREEAESTAYRDRVWDWYTNDLYTRLEPGGSICLTMTPWHEDDLAGRIMHSEDGPNWTVVRLPAIAEENDPLGRQVGEALCPDRYPLNVLAEIRKVLGLYGFTALYQCRPAPQEGGRFKRGWLRNWRYENVFGTEFYRLFTEPAKLVAAQHCRKFGTVDLACSTKTSADYTVISAWAVTPASELVLLDVDRDHMEDPAIIPAIKRMVTKHQLDYVGIEAPGMQLAMVQRARHEGLAIKALPADRDKLSRAIPATIRMEAGQVYFPDRTQSPWVEEFLLELFSFPGGKHDDCVDTLSYAALELQSDGAINFY